VTLHADWWLVVLGFPLVVVDGTREKGKTGDKVVFDKKPRTLFLRGFSCLGPLVVGSEKQVGPFLFGLSLGIFYKHFEGRHTLEETSDSRSDKTLETLPCQ